MEVGFVAELDPARDWWAVRGEGAFLRRRARSAALEPGPLEVLGLETARPALVAGAAEALAGLEARRLRVLGSVAASMCLVAAGRLDAMVTLREVRSVDVAAAQLIVAEAGGAVALPGGDALDLDDALTRVAAARRVDARRCARPAQGAGSGRSCGLLADRRVRPVSAQAPRARED